MKSSKHNQKGFSLVEILVAIVVLTAITVPLLSNFFTSSRINSKSKKVLNATIQAQNIMEGISAYGIEKTILQLEDANLLTDRESDDTILTFMPKDMTVGSWGEAVLKRTPEGELDVDDDRFGDQPPTRKIKIAGYSNGSDAGAESMVRSYVTPGSKAFFEPKDHHSFAFWMKGVKYGDSSYGEVECDILITVDGDYYRASATDTPVDTANDSAVSISNGRFYNSVVMPKIMTVNSQYDGHYVENSSDFMNAVAKLLQPGDTADELKKHVQRELMIGISRDLDGNIQVSALNKYTVDTTAWWSHVDLYKAGDKDTLIDSAPTPIYDGKVTKKEPRNIYIYYYGNYVDSLNSKCHDNIKIVNMSAKAGEDTEADVNIVLIRMEGENTTLASEQDYHANVEIIEKHSYTSSGGSSVPDINTSLATNVGHNIKKLGDDAYPDQTIPGITYSVKSETGSLLPSDVQSAFMINSFHNFITGENEDDRMYFVTVEVFEAGGNFEPDARTGKFTGTIARE